MALIASKRQKETKVLSPELHRDRERQKIRPGETLRRRQWESRKETEGGQRMHEFPYNFIVFSQ